MGSRLTNSQVRDELKEDIRQLFALADENRRTLRGYDGEKGLVTVVNDLVNKVAQISQNDIPHLNEDLKEEIKRNKLEAITFPKLGTWLISILTGGIGAVLATILHQIFFK